MARKTTPKSRAMTRKPRGGSVALAEQSEFRALTINPDEIAEVILTNVGPDGLSQFDLDRIKMPSGGATQWNVETIRGEESRESIEGIIIAHKTARVYWAEPMEKTGGNTPPDCGSDDGIRGSRGSRWFMRSVSDG